MLEQDQRPLADLFGRVLDDGKAYAKAEFDLARVKAEEAAADYRRAAILAGIGGAFAVASIICLCLTLVLAFAKFLGPLVGGVVATLFVAAISGILIYIALRDVKATNARLTGDEDDDDE